MKIPDLTILRLDLVFLVCLKTMFFYSPIFFATGQALQKMLSLQRFFAMCRLTVKTDSKDGYNGQLWTQ